MSRQVSWTRPAWSALCWSVIAVAATAASMPLFGLLSAFIAGVATLDALTLKSDSERKAVTA